MNVTIKTKKTSRLHILLVTHKWRWSRKWHGTKNFPDEAKLYNPHNS